MITQVTDKLYRGPRPRSFSELQPLGITDVINLQWGPYEMFHEDTYEKENGADFGIVEHILHCSDITPPTDLQVQHFQRIVKKAKGNVFVHCLVGKDRTGYMCATWRMQVQGWSFLQAREELFKMGFHKFPYIWWLFKLKEYEK